jgi:hypothetical protein
VLLLAVPRRLQSRASELPTTPSPTSSPHSPRWIVWDDLGGFNAGPSVASWSANRLDVFVRGARQTMLHRPYNRAKCTQRSRGSRGRPTRHFRARRSDQRWQEAWNGGWMGYYPGGGLLTSSPAVASWAPNRLDVFVPAATTRFTATHGRLAVITCSSTSNCSPLSAARCLTAWTQSFAASAYTSLGCPSSSAFAGPWCSQSAADS